jgi:hypothetical protein
LTGTYNKNGEKKSDTKNDEYPLYHEVQTVNGIRWYKTFQTKLQKICTVSATEQEIKLINYLIKNK